MQTREYITKNPIRSTISATGYGVVNAIELAVDGIDVARDIMSIAKHTLAESKIEAEVDALKAELIGMDEIEKLKQQLAEKRSMANA